MKFVAISNQTDPRFSPIRAKYCASFFCQLRGLMFSRSLPEDAGVLLVQSNDSRLNSSIHMMFMYMDLAVFWINSEFTVVDKVLARRWKLGYLPGTAAMYVLETGTAHLSDYNIGDLVRFDECN